jgi:hypothetical protein
VQRIRIALGALDAADILTATGLVSLAYGLSLIAVWAPFVVVGGLFVAAGTGLGRRA